MSLFDKNVFCFLFTDDNPSDKEDYFPICKTALRTFFGEVLRAIVSNNRICCTWIIVLVTSKEQATTVVNSRPLCDLKPSRTFNSHTGTFPCSWNPLHPIWELTLLVLNRLLRSQLLQRSNGTRGHCTLYSKNKNNLMKTFQKKIFVMWILYIHLYYHESWEKIKSSCGTRWSH